VCAERVHTARSLEIKKKVKIWSETSSYTNNVIQKKVGPISTKTVKALPSKHNMQIPPKTKDENRRTRELQ
jgi:hypothetical protein